MMPSEAKVEAPPAGLVVLFWAIERFFRGAIQAMGALVPPGSITQIGEDFVLVSDASDVADVREAVIRKFPDTAGGEANKLVVRPNRGGEPLTALRTKLSAVKFEREDDRSLHASVEVPPKAEEGPAGPAISRGVTKHFFFKINVPELNCTNGTPQRQHTNQWATCPCLVAIIFRNSSHKKDGWKKK